MRTKFSESKVSEPKINKKSNKTHLMTCYKFLEKRK